MREGRLPMGLRMSCQLVPPDFSSLHSGLKLTGLSQPISLQGNCSLKGQMQGYVHHYIMPQALQALSLIDVHSSLHKLSPSLGSQTPWSPTQPLSRFVDPLVLSAPFSVLSDLQVPLSAPLWACGPSCVLDAQ